jgi:methylated-DNA-[protein]-cysteine S-methyltransferase
MNYQIIDSPIGKLRLVSDGQNLVEIEFEGTYQARPEDVPIEDNVLQRTTAQLLEYFSGQRQQFDLPLCAAGTDFQKLVWSALAQIPYGELRSYRDIAREIGRPKAVRAVGAANGRNPLPVIVPCHRVVGSDGSLTGFSGGLAIKTRLLILEGALQDSS